LSERNAGPECDWVLSVVLAEHISRETASSLRTAVRFWNHRRPRFLEAQNHCGQIQGLKKRKKIIQTEKDTTAFRFRKIAAVDSCGHPCELRLADTAASAQAPKQSASPERKLFVMIFRTSFGRSFDFEYNVAHVERAIAGDTFAIPWVLASVAALARDGFAFTD